MTDVVTFKISSLVPGYRGEAEVKSDAVAVGTFVYISDVVDWYCRHLGRDVLSDDDYVLEVKTSSNEQTSSVFMSEIQIVAPDSEIEEMVLSQVCYICILDAQTIRPGGILPRTSSTLSYFTSKVKRPSLYLALGTLLILAGMVFVILAAADSGPFITITDEALVINALMGSTVISQYQWVRRQYMVSEVDPRQRAILISNVSLHHTLDQPKDAAEFLLELVQEFSEANQVSQDTQIFFTVNHDFQVISPGNVTKLISTVQKTFTKKKYKILTPNVSNGKLSAQTVWITKFLWNGTDYVSGIQNVSGALQLTSLSAAIAFPYTNSSFTDSGKEAVRFNFKSTNYSLYANTADCFGVQSSIARYYWNIWKSTNFSEEVDCPCYMNKSERVIELNELEKYKTCFENTSLHMSDHPENFTLKGTGSSASQCESSMIKSVFKANEDAAFYCECDGFCGLGGVCQPRLNKTNHLVASGAYAGVLQNMKLNETVQPSFKQFIAAVNDTCKEEVSVDGEEENCIQSVFVKIVLTSPKFGYGLKERTWNLTFAENDPSKSFYSAVATADLIINSRMFPNMNGQVPSVERQYAERGILFVLGLTSLLSGVVVIGILVKKRTKKPPDSFSYHEFDY